MKGYQIAFVVAFLFGSVTTCPADIIIDPIYPSDFGLNFAYFVPIGQSFTADSSNIKWIGMFIESDLEQTFQLDLLNGAGTSGQIVATKTSVAPEVLNGFFGFLYFDFSDTSLVVGDAYTSRISPLGEAGAFVYGTGDVYPGGMAFWGDYLSGGPGHPHPEKDFYLRVLSTDEIPPIPHPLPPVPEPSTLILLGFGLAVVGAWGRRKIA